MTVAEHFFEIAAFFKRSESNILQQSLQWVSLMRYCEGIIISRPYFQWFVLVVVAFVIPGILTLRNTLLEIGSLRVHIFFNYPATWADTRRLQGIVFSNFKKDIIFEPILNYISVQLSATGHGFPMLGHIIYKHVFSLGDFTCNTW